MLTIVTVTHMIPTLHHSSQLGARFDLTGATPQRCAAATEPARAAGGAGGVAATCDGGDEVPGDWLNGKIMENRWKSMVSGFDFPNKTNPLRYSTNRTYRDVLLESE